MCHLGRNILYFSSEMVVNTRYFTRQDGGILANLSSWRQDLSADVGDAEQRHQQTEQPLS